MTSDWNDALALGTAIRTGDDMDVASALIDCGAYLEAPDGSIGTPLDNAIGYGCWHVARLLIARGAACPTGLDIFRTVLRWCESSSRLALRDGSAIGHIPPPTVVETEQAGVQKQVSNLEPPFSADSPVQALPSTRGSAPIRIGSQRPRAGLFRDIALYAYRVTDERLAIDRGFSLERCLCSRLCTVHTGSAIESRNTRDRRVRVPGRRNRDRSPARSDDAAARASPSTVARGAG